MNFRREFNLHKSQIFGIAMICVLLGTALGNFVSINPFIIFCLLLISALGLIFFISPPFQGGVRPARIAMQSIAGGGGLPLFSEISGNPLSASLRSPLERGRKIHKFFFLLSFCFLLGLFRYQISLPNYSDANKIYYYNNEKVNFVGVVTKVDKRISYQKLTINSQELILGKKSQDVSGKVLMNQKLYPVYNYGDKLEIYCTLAKPEKIEDFDYDKYLARYNIYSLCPFGDIGIVGRNEGNWFMAQILNLKKKMSQGLNLSINEPEASLMQGMILGDTGSISADWSQKFSDLGITHIIAVSGSHMVVISAMFMFVAIALGLGRKRAFWFASIGIAIYTIMIGMPSSAVRSAIMGIMFLYAQKIGRPGSAGNLILLSAVVMVLVNPKVLLFDAGFQLSFMAVVGLVYFLPILEKYLRRIPNAGQLKEMALTTVAAELATLPLLIYYFQKISLISILANMLILPIIPALMILGFVNAVVSLLFLPLARVVGLVNWLLALYWLKVTDILHALPYGFFNVKINIWGLLIMYLVIFALRFWFSRKRNSLTEKNVV